MTEAELLTNDDGLVGEADQGVKTLSLMAGVVGPEGLPEAAQIGQVAGKTARSKMLTQGSLLVVVVFVIAAGALYGMRLSQPDMGSSSQAKNVEAKIDQALAKLERPNRMVKGDASKPGDVSSVSEDTEDIVSVFSTDMTQRQIPARFVKKNPFVVPEFEPVNRSDVQRVTAEDLEKKNRLMMLEREVDQLELQSIMRGSRPVAVISGQLVQPGQSVGKFTLKVIRNFSVDLESEGDIFTLRMDSPSDPRSGSSGGPGGFRR